MKDLPYLFSCWAFSATETIESAWIIAGKSTDSPQQIVDCDNFDTGCGGGWMTTAYQYGVGFFFRL
jgi:hypothetical protein